MSDQTEIDTPAEHDTPDTETDAPVERPAPEAPPIKFSYPSTAAWEVHGPARSKNLDLAVTHGVELGLRMDLIVPGRYRVTFSSTETLGHLGAWLLHFKPAGVGMCAETAPEGTGIRFELLPDRTPPRVALIHGQTEPERCVARAIDAGLIVRCVGLNRYDVRGPTRRHTAWLMDLFEVTQARALEIMNLTAEQAAAEDAAAPIPAVNVVLPVRETASIIQRDHRGDITRVTQTEKTVR